jgi:hypothetical protein
MEEWWIREGVWDWIRLYWIWDRCDLGYDW